jgi:hypothetical protein
MQLLWATGMACHLVACWRAAAMRLAIACLAIGGVPDRSAGGEIDLVYELVGIATGEVSQLGDSDGFQAGDDSRPA